MFLHFLLEPRRLKLVSPIAHEIIAAVYSLSLQGRNLSPVFGYVSF